MKNNIYLLIAIGFIGLFFTACVKDTDFDQGNIGLTPIVELDLIYFNLVAADFFDQATATPVLTVNDTTQIDFLNDSGIQDNLVRADFQFLFTNSIPREFRVVFNFLNDNNVVKYTTETSVVPGNVETPVVTDFRKTLEGRDIIRLTNSTKVVVSVTIPSSNINLEGVLNLKSKATYYVEL